jgi:hypothetical protein
VVASLRWHFGEQKPVVLSDPRSSQTPACVQGSWPVNRQTPSPIRFPAPKRPAETARSRKKPQELTGKRKFVIFFTNSLSTVSAGLWLSTSGGAWRPRIQPHPHDFQFRHRPSARRGARPSLPAAEPGQSQRGCWRLNRIPGGPVLRERKVDSHPETLPVVCSPPGPCGLWVQSPLFPNRLRPNSISERIVPSGRPLASRPRCR